MKQALLNNFREKILNRHLQDKGTGGKEKGGGSG